jgi:hypothetical protein
MNEWANKEEHSRILDTVRKLYLAKFEEYIEACLSKNLKWQSFIAALLRVCEELDSIVSLFPSKRSLSFILFRIIKAKKLNRVQNCALSSSRIPCYKWTMKYDLFKSTRPKYRPFLRFVMLAFGHRKILFSFFFI